jgi:hypothetical protein
MALSERMKKAHALANSAIEKAAKFVAVVLALALSPALAGETCETRGSYTHCWDISTGATTSITQYSAGRILAYVDARGEGVDDVGSRRR